MTHWLTAPAPPDTSNVVSADALARITACMAVIAGISRQAPVSKATPAGRGTAWEEGRTMNSAGGPEASVSLPVPNPYAFADTGLRHAGTDFVDHAGAIAMRDDARERYFSGGAQAGFDVRRVDAGGGKPDADFAWSCVWRFDFADLYDLARRAITLVIRRLHGHPPRRGAYSTPGPRRMG